MFEMTWWLPASAGRLRAALFLSLLLLAGMAAVDSQSSFVQVSGIYPHLAVFNDTGPVQDAESGIGAVVPWAGKLWVMSYPPHRRTGSVDKLYAIDSELGMTIRPESVGGTHAGRMIHRESQQLLLGPYVIDANGRVRAFDQSKGFPARITGIARHLTDPANKVYIFDMEGPIWEANVRTLEVRRLFVKPVPGWHGKGAYTGQGHLIVANNGESRPADLNDLVWEAPESTWSRGPEDAGVLAEWDGRAWTIVSRRPHTEVTGPGGLLGEPSADAPVWSTGWDKRSVLLHVRAGGGWHRYRLPKGSYTYDPAHGWFTEWPRIRSIGDGPLLLNMHGTFFDFPAAFVPGQASGVRPLSTHLHYTTDFTEWNGRVVLSGDDTSILQNPLASKPQSNLRFLARSQLATDFGPRSGWGGVWVDDEVQAGQASDPILIAGYAQRYLHLVHDAPTEVTFVLEVDRRGDGHWETWQRVRVPAAGYHGLSLPGNLAAEWLRVKADRACRATAYLHLQSPRSPGAAANAFASLAPAGGTTAWTGGLVRPAGFSRDLQFLARSVGTNGKSDESYYEINERLQFTRVTEPAKIDALKNTAEPKADSAIDAASVVVTDADGGRWRLPKRPLSIGPASDPASERGIREVISERFLAQFDGTFYEIPRLGKEPRPDYRRMKAVATHGARITDFCTWRGLLVLAGTRPDAAEDGHYFRASDGSVRQHVGLWFGAIDDLYKLGAPVGEGGPWQGTLVRAAEPSDPYLMTNFGRKAVTLSHDSSSPVRFTIEIDFLATGSWRRYAVVEVPAGEQVTHAFPEGFAAHWVRITSDRSAKATAWFRYDP